MKRLLLRMFLAALTALVLGGTAWSAPGDAVGMKNFERARRAGLRGDTAGAKGYYAKAADAFMDFIAVKDADGKDVFNSTLTAAGMSLYGAGRFAEAVQILDRAAADAENHEAWVWGGLAEARLGRKAEALQRWARYPVSADQTFVAAALKEQAMALQSGGASMEQAAQSVEDALARQMQWNLTVAAHSPGLRQMDRCSGPYWWRYADSPCPVSNVTPLPSLF